MSRCDQSRPAGPANLVARETNLTPAAVTTLIDRLEKRGFVSRQPDPMTGARSWSRRARRPRNSSGAATIRSSRRAPHCSAAEMQFLLGLSRGRSDAEGADREGARQSKTGALREGIGGWSGETPVRFQVCTVKETLCPA
ncbi:MarR family transcriptional regulator [Mesorhizobium sp. C120A]|nr:MULTISPECIES: MarR family transcriptional regulator [unclassified Mesorhizobium]WJI48228.1 MarR family transcriptional regulator [Mesorhizobium sp. C120A]